MTSEDYGYLRELADQFLLDTFGGKLPEARNVYMEAIAEFLEYAENIETPKKSRNRKLCCTN